MESFVGMCLAPLKSRRLWWRAFWAMMLLFHAPATLAALMSLGSGGEAIGISQCLLLLTSNVFFIFELIFVSSLRLLKDRRSALVFMLIVALIHVGVIERGLPGSAVIDDAHPLLFFAIIGAFGCGLLALARAAAVLLASRAADRPHLWTARRRYAYAAALTSTIRTPQCGWRSSPLRAPPSI